MSEENSEAGITTPMGTVSFKGKKTAEFIAIVCLFLMGLFGYILWEHKADAKVSDERLANRDTQIALAIRDMASSNRVLACLMATKQEEREAKLQQCERIAR
jgi:hypothetical protein